ncbi:MAG: hypothetical protein Q4G25_16565 [Paracoccus sp. (in: a-proteobacteria)]|nr:hypothetical protein [Paracoccus sp. (in: a-proteobacteria)]
MQMLVHYTIADYARFKTAFDADAEDRGNNSLSLLQLWRESGSSAWALYQVADAKQAQDYLNGAAGAFNAQAGVSATALHLLETA